MSPSWLTLRRVLVVAALAAPGVVACARDLNPQPLPPEEDKNGESDDRGGDPTAGFGGAAPPPGAEPNNSADSGTDPRGQDAGDAGDGG